jgi:hypothetical protein
MKLARDIAAFVLTALTVLVYATTHERWDIWMIGDSHRWGAALISLLAALVFLFAAFPLTMPLGLFATFAIAAAVLAVVALATASLTPLSILVALVVVVWLAATAEDVLHVPRKPVAT